MNHKPAHEIENKIEKIIAQRFTSSSMSDSKWRKVFVFLFTPELGLSGCRWKFVDDERVFQTGLPRADDLAESHLLDGSYQPFVYKDIEWIEVASSNVDDILAGLERVGHFDVKSVVGGMRIYGYR